MSAYLDSLPIGRDPRVFNQFLSLKEELDKRFHPARPDINWQQVYDLCLSLFNQNGIDLQTTAWFVLCRQQQAGLNGLNEGLSLIHKILIQHWQTIWPTQTHTRVSILSSLSQQLVTGIRGTHFVYADLPLLYQVEESLKNINGHLQQLELKHLIQFEHLQSLIITQAKQLENADTLDNDFYPLNVSSPSTIVNKGGNSVTSSTEPSLSNINTFQENQAAPQSYTSTSIQLDLPIKKKNRRDLWQGIFIGVLLSSLCFFVIFYFWLSELKDERLIDTLPYIPTFNSHTSSIIEQQLTNYSDIEKPLNQEQFSLVQQRLDELLLLSPIWAQSYGIEVVNYLKTQYENNDEVSLFIQSWKGNIQVNAMGDDKLTQWSEGMAQLDALSERLDSFDGNPKNYITGSELKSIIFKARQHFIQGKPLEEELRLLERQPSKEAIPDSEYQQIDNHFKQLLNRYALLRNQ